MVCAALALCAIATARPARAWDATTTHAGLTERAALASRLHRVLVESLGRPLGLYETLGLGRVPADEREARLRERLARLPAGEGFAPSPEGRLPALGWLVAGSVLEEVPAARMANHYYDPVTRKGLDQGGFLDGTDLRAEALGTGAGTLRALMSGGGLDGEGRPSIAWLTAPDNDLGLGHFLDARERAVSAATPAARDAALAEALLGAGALVHIVEDAGEPALVRGDYRIELAGPWAPLRRYVAERYGRIDVPAPSGGAIAVAHLADLVTAPDASGLADRTARRFFSLGSLPGTPLGARHAEPVAYAGPGAVGYIARDGIAHLARWQRDRGGAVRWSLDERCYADYAPLLLGDTARAALSALDHLFRGALVLEGDTVRAGDLGLGSGRLAVYAEDASGARRAVLTRDTSGAAAGDSLGELPAAPEGARRMVALFRGVDANREPIVLSIERPVAP